MLKFPPRQDRLPQFFFSGGTKDENTMASTLNYIPTLRPVLSHPVHFPLPDHLNKVYPHTCHSHLLTVRGPSAECEAYRPLRCAE